MVCMNTPCEVPTVNLLFQRGGTVPADTALFWGGEDEEPCPFPMFVPAAPHARELKATVWWAPVYVHYHIQMVDE